MYALILKIAHNPVIKDSIAVMRGLYRVAQTLLPPSQNKNTNAPTWMEDPVERVDVKSHQITYHIQKQQEILKQGTEDHSTILGQNSNKQYLRKLQQLPVSPPQNYNPQVSKIPSSRLSRILSFGRLGWNLASVSIFSKGRQQSDYQQLAEKLTNQLCKMRGAPLKLAQMLSIQQQNLIPAAMRKAFERARQSAHVIPQQQVQFMLNRNLGQNWKSKFKEFNMRPFAAASIGQVHRGVLTSGEEVAVKVQYYKVKQSINSDIGNIGLVLKVPGLMPKTMYIQRILKKMKQQLMQQCNYLRQASYQQLYYQYLQQTFTKQSHLYRVPLIYPQMTTPEVLISQHLSGIKIKQLQENNYPQELKDQIGRRIMKLTFKQLFEMGIMQSDPNPSNYTYNHRRDQLNLFDFGATHIYNPQFLESYYQIIRGAVNEDQELIWQGSIQTGFVTNEQNRVMKNSHIESIMVTGQPLRFRGYYNFGAQDITNKIYKTIPMMLKNRLKAPPEEVYSLHRKLSGSYLACIRLKARVNCNEIWEGIRFRTLAGNEKEKKI